LKIGYAGRDSLLFPIPNPPMCPLIKVPGTMVGSNSSTPAPGTSYMHLRIPRPFTTNNVTDMSLVISSLHPQNTRNGRNCLFDDPIETTEPNTPPKKTQGLLPTPNPTTLANHKEVGVSVPPNDGLDCNAPCNSCSHCRPLAYSLRRPRHGCLERNRQAQPTNVRTFLPGAESLSHVSASVFGTLHTFLF